MATGNQNTFDHMGRNFNVRLSDELRGRLDKVGGYARMTRADIIRAALENYLPILEMTTTPRKKS